jgi:hypothetical protein
MSWQESRQNPLNLTADLFEQIGLVLQLIHDIVTVDVIAAVIQTFHHFTVCMGMGARIRGTETHIVYRDTESVGTQYVVKYAWEAGYAYSAS